MGMVVLRLIRAVGHDPPSSLNSDTEKKRGNIEKTKILSLLRGIALEDGGLDCDTENSLIRVGVDALVGLLTSTNEKVGKKIDDKRIRMDPPTKTKFHGHSICRS